MLVWLSFFTQNLAEVQEERFAPEIQMALEDLVTQDGGQARFTANIIGVPQPEVTWYKEDDVLYSSDIFEITQDDENNYILFIHDVLPEDAGRYVVVAKNEMGTVKSTAQLTVEGKAALHRNSFILLTLH